MNSLATVPRLTSLSHGGGCGCKIAPGVLADLLHASTPAVPAAALLVGRETGDDAVVYRVSDELAVIATTDFFMPIVDDPFDFGRIAAANALSDVYAMGGKPLFALAIVGMPIAVLPVSVIREILRGGEALCAAAGVPVAGGHSIDSVEPIYGLAVIGQAAPADIRRNCDAKAGDALVLGKPLGVGILSAALKREKLDAAGYARMIETTTRLNSAGPALARVAGVHAMTDVTGASQRNWTSYGASVQLGDGIGEAHRALLTDPQTSGGLLVSCEAAALGAVLEEFRCHGCDDAAVIGQLLPGEPGIQVS